MLKEFAEKLNGCEEISKENIQFAKENGIVIVYGSSDDIMSFDGAISDEGDCDDGGDVFLRKSGVIHNVEECEEAIETLKDNGFDGFEISEIASKIEALWCPDGINDNDGKHIDGISWAYKTEIPHETFFMLEDDQIYCRGIVFKKSDLK